MKKQTYQTYQKGNAMIWIIVVVVVAVIIGIYYFSRGGNQPAVPSSYYPSAPSTQTAPQPSNGQTNQPTAPAATSPAGNQTNAVAVTIQNFAFSPASLTIKKGDVVTWTNQDSAPHQVTSDNGKFQGPAISKSETYSFTFNETGTFPYHCAIHPMMKGTITVQ